VGVNSHLAKQDADIIYISVKSTPGGLASTPMHRNRGGVASRTRVVECTGVHPVSSRQFMARPRFGPGVFGLLMKNKDLWPIGSGPKDEKAGEGGRTLDIHVGNLPMTHTEKHEIASIQGILQCDG
jgi:hypothetical protein